MMWIQFGILLISTLAVAIQYSSPISKIPQIPWILAMKINFIYLFMKNPNEIEYSASENQILANPLTL